MKITGLNKEQLKKYLEVVHKLEYLGIIIEDFEVEKDFLGFPTNYIFYYSVPASSTIEADDENVNTHTADNLMQYAKDTLLKLIASFSASDKGLKNNKFMEALMKYSLNKVKFRAKVREGEVWTKELAEAKLKKLDAELREALSYKEV